MMVRSADFRLNPALGALIMMLFGIPSIFGVNADIQGPTRVIIQLVGVALCGLSIILGWMSMGMYITRLSARKWILVLVLSFILAVLGTSGVVTLYITDTLSYYAAYSEAAAWLGIFGLVFDIRVATTKPSKKSASSTEAATAAA